MLVNMDMGGELGLKQNWYVTFNPLFLIFEFMCILLLIFYSEWVIRFWDFIGLQKMENHRSPSLSEMAVARLDSANNQNQMSAHNLQR
jgi:hypothetical protein